VEEGEIWFELDFICLDMYITYPFWSLVSLGNIEVQAHKSQSENASGGD